MAEPDPLITTTDAAKLLRIHRSTLARWAGAGHITYAQKTANNTGVMLFRRSDIEALATQRAREAEARKILTDAREARRPRAA